MQVQKTDLKPTEIQLRISATENDLRPIKQRVLSLLAKNLKIPGFRGGKVPLELAEKHLGSQHLQTEFLDEAMTVLYSKACQEKNIRPVSQPQVSIKKFVPFDALEFEVTAEIIGPITLGKYKGLKTTVTLKEIKPTDIETVVENLRQRSANRKPVERVAKLGDEVIINFKGLDASGKQIDGAEGSNYPLILGSNNFIPGFEDNLVGLTSSESKTFNLTFPKDYGAKKLASQKVTFTVEITAVNELIKPAVDDSFAAKVGPYKTVDALKKDIHEQLSQEATREHARARQNELLLSIVEKSDVAIPETLIDQQTAVELQNAKQEIAQRGQTFSEFLESQGYTEDSYKEEVIKPEATRQVKIGIILSEIANVEKIEVTVEELETQLELLKSQYNDPTMLAELGKPESRRDIASRILSQKVINFIENN